MKKQEMNRLHFKKSVISKLAVSRVNGGNRISTAEHCIITGVPDGCIVSENCNTNGCGGGGGGTQTCETFCQFIPCYG
ncbi:hypothetical protein ACJD0Z_03560 [Flavobacteriaceae bacterium M23B6Z8]